MPPATPFRVLCVDDNLDACEVLSMLLKMHNLDATCAQSAAEAALMIAAERFDLYLLDSWLPGMDGFEFCREIRKTDVHTPIVFYSGAAYDADKTRAKAAGANAYVTKPDIETLIQTAVELLRTPGMSRSQPAELAASAGELTKPSQPSWSMSKAVN